MLEAEDYTEEEVDKFLRVLRESQIKLISEIRCKGIPETEELGSHELKQIIRYNILDIVGDTPTGDMYTELEKRVSKVEELLDKLATRGGEKDGNM